MNNVSKNIISESVESFPELLDESTIEYKSLGETFMYHTGSIAGKYNDKIFAFITRAHRIDTKSKEFSDIMFDIKRRRISENLIKIIESKNIILGMLPNEYALPGSLKVFVAKNIKDSNPSEVDKIKLFIDVGDFIVLNNGNYECKNLDWLISYIIAGAITYIYAMIPDKLMTNQTIINKSVSCYTRLMSYIIDRLTKITSVPQLKTKIDYYIALFFLNSVMCKKDLSFDTVKSYAIKATNISEIDSSKVDMMIRDDSFIDIATFINSLSRNFNVQLNVAGVTSVWLKSFQYNTQFALEYFPAFASMIIYAYIGGYLVNQNAIEKICGVDYVILSKEFIKILDEVK